MRISAVALGAVTTAAVLVGDWGQTASALSRQLQSTALSIPQDVNLEEIATEAEVSAALAEVEQETLKNSVRAKLAKLMQRVKQVLQDIGLLANKKCEEKKKKGGTPSAADGDSPLNTFGYPYFDERSGASFLRPQTSLSDLEGHKQPVRVGAKDWMVQGTLSDIVSLLMCFESYTVIGEFLRQDGHWDSSDGAGPLHVQLQNVNKHQGSAAEILVGYSLDRITNLIDVWGVIDSRVGNWLGAGEGAVQQAKSVYDTYKTIRERIPDLTRQSFETFWNDVAKAKTAREKLKAFGALFYNAGKASLHGQWQHLERVDPNGKLTAVITSYPSNSPMMATFTFDTNVVLLGEIGTALAAVNRNALIDEIFKKAGMAK